MTAAFQEFSAKKLNREKKPSIRKSPCRCKGQAKQLNAARDKVKKMDRGARYEADQLQKADTSEFPYVFFVYLFDKVGQAVRLAPGADISAKILNITQGFSAAFENALPSVLPVGFACRQLSGAVIIRLIVYVKGKNAKKYRKGRGVRLCPMGETPKI